MPNQPYQEDPTRVSAEAKTERMPDLPSKPVAPAPVAQTPSTDTPSEADIAETRQEEARTIKYAIGKLSDFVQWFIAVLEVTLALRFLLKLIGANPGNLFAGFLYALTDILLFPFNGILSQQQPIRPGQGPSPIFEWSAIIGMIVYALLFWAIRQFLRILISGPEEAES